METDPEETCDHLRNILLSRTNRHLVVDDSKTNRIILRLFIENKSPGIVVDEAENGRDALTCVDRVGLDGYDVVWTDLNMDIMDGVEFVKRMRKLGYQKYLIVVTGTSDAGMLAACKEVDVDLLIRKPVSKKEVHAVMHCFASTKEVANGNEESENKNGARE
jgi:CheY-like chemotaxis protein